MQIQIRFQPSFSVARFTLGPNEPIRAESGAMMAMSADTTIAAKAEGGMLKSLKRAALGGESFFITTLTGGPEGGWVDLAPNLPGDLMVVELHDGRDWILAKGAFLGAGSGVTIESQFRGMRMFAGGEGAFLIGATGQGPVVVSAFGAIDRIPSRPTSGWWSTAGTSLPARPACSTACAGRRGRSDAIGEERRGFRVRVRRTWRSADAEPQPVRSHHIPGR